MSDFLLSHPAPNRSNFTGAVGCTFKVTNAVLITRLGRFYDAGSTRNHQITLWISTNQTNPISQGTILASSASDSNGFKWFNLPVSVILFPGNLYAIAIDELNGGDNWPDNYSLSGRTDSNFNTFTSMFTATPGAYPSSTQSAGNTYTTPNMEDVSQLITSTLQIQINEALAMTDSLKIGYGLLPTDALTMSDQVQVAAPMTLVLTDTMNNWQDSIIKFLQIPLLLSDNLNFWSDAGPGGVIGLGARISQAIAEVLLNGISPNARVSQLVAEVIVSRQLNQPRISVST